jgi:hypothetical protein
MTQRNSRKMARRKLAPRKLASPFLTTVAAAAAAMTLGAGGCTTDIRFADSCDFGEDGCDAPCPEAFPSAGDSCVQLGQSCHSYSDCSDTTATCGDDGAWSVEVQQSSCNPPPPVPVCPAELPEDGGYCEQDWSGSEYVCDGYLDPFCGLPVSATCTFEGIWSVTQIDCNPPPPIDCRQLANDADCVQFAECRWLEPGCGGGVDLQTGCYPTDPCTADSCLGGETCSEVIYHPCPDGKCNACGAMTNICIAPTTGN